ncbi:hypothetical protein AN958_08929 [Leucoagaricus sp. SymC.cos]|nr:hypothetical protein AN958_08929 [Leucoagaricus sp. SymC.cos]
MCLKQAYRVIFQLFVAFGLVLEHNKSELFHFSHRKNDDNPPIDLGYAPYMGDSPLCPKTFWRYLGFYFDRQLTFQEHIRYYSTKAISTVRAMGMLGNSLQGLTPKQKCLLYRLCVVPIATYSFHLWCHGLHPHKAHLASLNKM